MINNNKEFVDRLSKDNLSSNDKIETCQYYIDNYPVNIMGLWTSISLNISGGSDKAINFAFNQLKSRIKEFSK